MNMKKIQVRDVELAYRDEGAGRTIVFLHGFALTQRAWDEQLAALALKYRVITLDWRGFGESTVGNRPPSIEAFADDLAGLLDALKIDRATICGLSMGGYAAFAFYCKFADRVESLILADTRAGVDAEAAKRTRYEMAATVRREGLAAMPDQVLPKWVAPSTLETRPQVVARVRSMIVNNQPEGVARAQEAMAERADSIPLLPNIRCRTLVIVGAEDALTPLNEARLMSDSIPGARLEVIPDAGHLSNLEQPTAFNRAVAEFLAEPASTQK